MSAFGGLIPKNSPINKCTNLAPVLSGKTGSSDCVSSTSSHPRLGVVQNYEARIKRTASKHRMETCDAFNTYTVGDDYLAVQAYKTIIQRCLRNYLWNQNNCVCVCGYFCSDMC